MSTPSISDLGKDLDKILDPRHRAGVAERDYKKLPHLFERAYNLTFTAIRDAKLLKEKGELLDESQQIVDGMQRIFIFALTDQISMLLSWLGQDLMEHKGVKQSFFRVIDELLFLARQALPGLIPLGPNSSSLQEEYEPRVAASELDFERLQQV